jgi:hypothetical protein
MPTRMVRDTLLDSHHYALLSTEAKLLYIHLLLLADDLGCVGVSETFLRRRAFHDAPSGQKIAALLTELADADMIRCYDVDRACYAFVPRFRQRLQRNTLKHPHPPESLYQDDDHAKDLFNKIKNKNKNPTVGQRLGNGSPTDGQPPEEEEKRSKEAASGHPSDVWTLGLQVLTDSGISEATARTYLGKLRKDYTDEVLTEALLASVGKTEPKSYLAAVLKTKPLKTAKRPTRADGLAL